MIYAQDEENQWKDSFRMLESYFYGNFQIHSSKWNTEEHSRQKNYDRLNLQSIDKISILSIFPKISLFFKKLKNSLMIFQRSWFLNFIFVLPRKDITSEKQPL